MEANSTQLDLRDLETERLLLRRMRMEDIPDVFEYASDPEVARFTTWEAHKSISDSEQFVTWVVNAYANPHGEGWAARGYANPESSSFTWGIVLKESGKLIGTIGISVNHRDARAEIGYAIGRPCWGRGLTTEAVQVVIKYAFEELGLNRIEARCDPENIGSARVMEKSGMTFEGVLRAQMFVKGRYDDLKIYSILRREYYAERERDQTDKG